MNIKLFIKVSETLIKCKVRSFAIILCFVNMIITCYLKLSQRVWIVLHAEKKRLMTPECLRQRPALRHMIMRVHFSSIWSSADELSCGFQGDTKILSGSISDLIEASIRWSLHCQGHLLQNKNNMLTSASNKFQEVV